VHQPSHLIISWLVGHRLEDRRDRLLATWAGLAPDIDGLSILGGKEMFAKWHHVLAHGITAAIITTSCVFFLAHRRVKTALAAFIAFHIHLLCDLLGSGTDWHMAYLYPFSDKYFYTIYGWQLNSWQNAVITAVAIGFTIAVGVKYKRTFAESFLPKSVDNKIALTLARRFRKANGNNERGFEL
jgi:LexA-binding, inner membrane-associated putative hydrolase